jgi:endonuclease-8
MPEGDTIHKVALALRPHVAGVPIRALRLPHGDVPMAAGTRGVAVKARGKHLIVTFGAPGAPPRVLRTHLGMNGSWHRYRPGERWRKSPSDTPHVAIHTDDWVLVCFQPAQCVLYQHPGDLERDPAIADLGPDLLGPGLDLDVVLARARVARNAARAVAEVLLDQRVAAGVGNVYKSEVLFLERVDPWAPVGAIPDLVIRAVYARAAALLAANVHDGARVTAPERAPFGHRLPPGLRHWVYRRAGHPCPRCRAPIAGRPQGPQVRMTYWCPSCQAPLVARPSPPTGS